MLCVRCQKRPAVIFIQRMENGQTKQLKAGDPLAEVVNTWHYGINPGNTPAEILVVYAGVEGVPTSIAKPKGR